MRVTVTLARARDFVATPESIRGSVLLSHKASSSARDFGGTRVRPRQTVRMHFERSSRTLTKNRDQQSDR